jgi:hypothetical protein
MSWRRSCHFAWTTMYTMMKCATWLRHCCLSERHKKYGRFVEAKSYHQLARSDQIRSLKIDQHFFAPKEVGDFKQLKLCTA